MKSAAIVSIGSVLFVSKSGVASIMRVGDRRAASWPFLDALGRLVVLTVARENDLFEMLNRIS